MLSHADHIPLIILGAQLLLNSRIGDFVQFGRINCCIVRVGDLDVVRSHGANSARSVQSRLIEVQFSQRRYNEGRW